MLRVLGLEGNEFGLDVVEDGFQRSNLSAECIVQVGELGIREPRVRVERAS
jgi:hypothetical protein